MTQFSAITAIEQDTFKCAKTGMVLDGSEIKHISLLSENDPLLSEDEQLLGMACFDLPVCEIPEECVGLDGLYMTRVEFHVPGLPAHAELTCLLPVKDEATMYSDVQALLTRLLAPRGPLPEDEDREIDTVLGF